MKQTLLKRGLILITICMLIISCFIVNKAKSKSNSNKNNNFKELNMSIDNTSIKYENKDLKLKLPIYIKTNRYYIPVNEFIDNANGKFLIYKDEVVMELNGKQNVITFNNNSYRLKGEVKDLKEKPIFKDGVLYMALFDFTKIFDLKTFWDVKNKSIYFYKNKESVQINKSIEENTRTALIRLEDVVAGDIYNSQESLEKLRTIGDYLFSESIPFHVAWVPRYVKPSDNIDNDLLKNYNMLNTNFVFTLDYLMDKGGSIGLHGYTHQYGKETSVDGIEFHANDNDSVPQTVEYAEERIKNALDTAEKLNIKCDFFETPHYAILPQQMSVIEKSFEYVYQPYSEDGGINEKKNLVETINNDKKSIYIPTPLDYIDGKNDCENMIEKINRLDEDTLGSFFYHPYIEFEDIKLYRDKLGYPCSDYSTNSVLHKVINHMKENGFRFYNVHSIS